MFTLLPCFSGSSAGEEEKPGRDHAAQPGGSDGGRRLPGHRRGARRASGRTRSSRWPTSGSTRWARTRSRRSTRSPDSGNPHPHNFTDRLIRPGDQASSTSSTLNGQSHLLLPDLLGRHGHPGSTRTPTRAGPGVDGSGYRRDQGRVGTGRGRRTASQGRGVRIRQRDGGRRLQFAHGLGSDLHERPIISRLNSTKEPVELEVDGLRAGRPSTPPATASAARIEEEIVITEDGPKVLTLFCPGTLRRQRLLSRATPAKGSTRS